MATQIDSELAKSQASGAFLFSIGDQVVFNKSYGALDGSGTPMPVNVLFPAGSLTKQFTAAAILQLAQQGRLRLDSNLGRFFPDVSADKRGITVHQLLSHTSGLSRNVGDVYDQVAADDFRQRVFAAPLDAAPGTRHAYSNSGYKLLGQIVERTSGMPLATYFDRHLIRRAGMTSTGYPSERSAGTPFPRGFDRPKFKEVYSGTPMTKAGEQDPRYRAGNGGMLSTVEDLYRWEIALRSGRILRPEWEKLMRTPHASITPDGKFRYGYGWVIQDSKSGPMFWHNGVWHSYYAEVRMFPEAGVIGVGFTNRQQDELFDPMFASALRKVLDRAKAEQQSKQSTPTAAR